MNETNSTAVADYHAALEAGNRAEVLRLANIIDWVAAAPVVAPVRRFVNLAAVPAEGRDYEGAILAQHEACLFE